VFQVEGFPDSGFRRVECESAAHGNMLHRCQLIATETSLNLLVANTASMDRHGNCQRSGKAVIES
jgi:hypothetical protein